jgi:PAS domain S-box-containing protein
VQANEAFCGILGYSEREVIERGWWGISYPDDRAIAEAGRQRLARDKCPSVDFEKRYVHKQGHAIWFRVRVSALRNRSGESAQFITHAEDITGRKQAADTLRRSEEKYRQLVNNIPNIVWTADARGTRVWVSRNCEAMCGHTPEELCQPQGWSSRVHPDDLPAVEEAYGALLARDEPYDVEYRLRRKDGLFLWVRDRAVSTYQRDGQRFTDGCVEDVTERRLYSDLVEQLQRRNELILNSAGEGILGLDSDGKFTFINPAAARMLGLSSQDAIGESAHELVPHTHAGGAACSAGDCAVTAALRDGAEHRGVDMALCPPGRESFPVEFVTTPKRDSGISPRRSGRGSEWRLP